MLIAGWRRLLAIGLAVLLAAGVLWFVVPSLWGRVIDAALKGRVEEFQKQTEASKKEASEERDRLLAAKAEAAGARLKADRFANEARRLGAERDALKEKIRSSADELEKIRADAATVPASELLGRIRRALAQLRGPGPGR
jgi:septal ring factor EnvC (AmiA/AmiB activator)